MTIKRFLHTEATEVDIAIATGRTNGASIVLIERRGGACRRVTFLLVFIRMRCKNNYIQFNESLKYLYFLIDFIYKTDSL